ARRPAGRLHRPSLARSTGRLGPTIAAIRDADDHAAVSDGAEPDGERRLGIRAHARASGARPGSSPLRSSNSLNSRIMTSIHKPMTSITLPKRSPIALAILAMLWEAPMHPYRMQRLIKERGKDEVINVAQRASLYQTIQRLEREGLISAQQKIRDDRRPERTIYEITERGRAVALDWMRDILSTPAKDYPGFPAAISFLPLLTPDDALRQLELRAKAIEAELARMDEGLKQAAQVPRL